MNSNITKTRFHFKIRIALYFFGGLICTPSEVFSQTNTGKTFTGRVIKIGNFYQFMVTPMELLPSEREELAQKVAELSPTNAQKRLELASWAESLATRYKDASLKQSVSQLRSEAYRILGTQEDQPGTPPGSSAIEAARDAKKAGSDPVIIHGLAHLGLRKAFAKLEDQAGLETLSREVAELLPDSTRRQLG